MLLEMEVVASAKSMVWLKIVVWVLELFNICKFRLVKVLFNFRDLILLIIELLQGKHQLEWWVLKSPTRMVGILGSIVKVGLKSLVLIEGLK